MTQRLQLVAIVVVGALGAVVATAESAQAQGEPHCMDCWYSQSSSSHIACGSWEVIWGWGGSEHGSFPVSGTCNSHHYQITDCWTGGFSPEDRNTILALDNSIDHFEGLSLLTKYPKYLQLAPEGGAMELLSCEGRIVKRFALRAPTLHSKPLARLPWGL